VNDPSPKAAPHPGINRARGPLVHYAEKTGNFDQLYWDRLAGKTPCQKRTTASTVNGHYSLMVELRLRVTTRVDHSGSAASPQIGVQLPLYSDSGRLVWDSGTRRWTIPTKTPGGHQPSIAMSPVTQSLKHEAYAERSRRTVYCRPPKCCLTSPSSQKGH